MARFIDSSVTTDLQQRERLGSRRAHLRQRLQQRMGRLTTTFLHQKGIKGASEIVTGR